MHTLHVLPPPLRCALVMQVRCVRADLVTRVDLLPNSPALIFYPYKQRAALSGWIADERAATFVAVNHDGTPQLPEAYRIKDAEQLQKEPQAAVGMGGQVAAGAASAALPAAAAAAAASSFLGHVRHEGADACHLQPYGKHGLFGNAALFLRGDSSRGKGCAIVWNYL